MDAIRVICAWIVQPFPIFRWLPKYSIKNFLLSDMMAGGALIALAAPEAISYAAIAGVPPANGLYTAFLAPLLYSLLGSSPHLLLGPTTLTSLLTAAALSSPALSSVDLSSPALSSVDLSSPLPSPLLYTQMAALLAVAVGVWQLGLRLLRAGIFVRLVPGCVLLGFTMGASLLIASTQFSTLLSVPKCTPNAVAAPGAPNNGTHVGGSQGACNFAEAVDNIVQHLDAIRWEVPLAAALSVALLLTVKHATPARFAMLRNAAPLVLLVLWVIIMWQAGDTLEAHGIQLVEHIPSGLPSPSSPLPSGLTASQVSTIFSQAGLVAAIGYMESIAIAQRISKQFGSYPVDNNQELLAMGACNILVGCFQGYSVTGSFSRTAVNAASGGKSPVSSLVAGFGLLIALLVMTPALSLMPKVATAAIVISVIGKLIEVGPLVAMWRADRREACIAVIVAALVMFMNVQTGLLAGIALGWANALSRTFVLPSELEFAAHRKPTLDANQDSMDMPSITLHFAPSLLFNDADRLRDHIARAIECYNPSKCVIVDLRDVCEADYDGMTALLEAASAAAGQRKRLYAVCTAALHDRLTKFAQASHLTVVLSAATSLLGQLVAVERIDDCTGHDMDVVSVPDTDHPSTSQTYCAIPQSDLDAQTARRWRQLEPRCGQSREVHGNAAGGPSANETFSLQIGKSTASTDLYVPLMHTTAAVVQSPYWGSAGSPLARRVCQAAHWGLQSLISTYHSVDRFLSASGPYFQVRDERTTQPRDDRTTQPRDDLRVFNWEITSPQSVQNPSSVFSP